MSAGPKCCLAQIQTPIRLQSCVATRPIAISLALETVGIEFIDENGGGPGVRLRKRHQKKS